MVSIIVCTYNREQYLPKTLEHLKNQSAANDAYEIVIINNKSTDNTGEVCLNFIQENNSLNISYHIEHNQGHTYARNRGIKESKGDLLAFIDDDAFVNQDYAKNIESFFSKFTDVAAIGGKITPMYESQEPKWMSKHLLPLVAALDMGSSIVEFKKRKFPIGANMAYRSTVFEKYGLFDVTLGRRGDGLEGGDEKDLIFRIKANEKVYYVPNVAVDHIIPDKRLSMEYIKGMALGVATSEIKRLKKEGAKGTIGKLLEEFVKLGGTFILSLKHILLFDFSKAFMLIKFRYWVFKGYLK